MKKNIPQILIGIGIFFTVYYLSNLYENLLISLNILKVEFNKNIGANTWSSHPLLIFITIFNTLSYTLPSYVTGWLSRTNGTLNGFIVAFISSLIQITLFQTNWDIVFFSISLIAHSLWVWFQSSVFTMVVGALSGAAGEAHCKSRKNLITTGSTRNPPTARVR